MEPTRDPQDQKKTEYPDINTHAPGPEEEHGTDNNEDRVFEFTPDLDIAQVKDPILRPAPSPVPPPLSVPLSATPTLHTSPPPTPSLTPTTPSPTPTPSAPTPPPPSPQPTSPLTPPPPTPPTPPVRPYTPPASPVAKLAPSPTPPTTPQSPDPNILGNNLMKGNQTPDIPRFQGKDPQKPIRTYESDVAEALARKKMSTASLIIAEKEQQKPPQPEIPTWFRGGEPIVPPSTVMRDPATGAIGTDATPHKVTETHQSGKKLFISLISMIFILGGLIVAYVLYAMSPFAQKTPPPQQSRETAHRQLIPSDTQTTLNLTDTSPNTILQSIKTKIAQTQPPQTIKEIIVTHGATRVTGPDMLKLMNILPPDMLTRSLTDDWMLGVHTDNQGIPDVFVVTTHNFFQNAFAGMLSWEQTLAQDIKLLLYPESVQQTHTLPEQQPVVSVTARSTSTPSSPQLGDTELSIDPYFTLRGQFVDGLVKNKDVRAFRSDNGRILFLYSLIDNNKIIVTSRESTLAAIITRLEQQAFVR